MPYVSKEARKKMEVEPPDTVGELTYVLTVGNLWAKSYADAYDLVLATSKEWLENSAEQFSTYCQLLGALYCAQREWQRRINAITHKELFDRHVIYSSVAFDIYQDHVAPYEDIKIKENGDVYP